MFKSRRFNKIRQWSSGAINTGSPSPTFSSSSRSLSAPISKTNLPSFQLSSPSNHDNPSTTTPPSTELSTFDACVETCDALAAASSSNGTIVNGEGTSSSSAITASNSDLEGVSDCSVMVSPDGALLFVPKTDETMSVGTSTTAGESSHGGGDDDLSVLSNSSSKGGGSGTGSGTGTGTGTGTGSGRRTHSPPSQTLSSLVPPPPPSPPSSPNSNNDKNDTPNNIVHTHSAEKTTRTASQLFPNEEYESAVIMGTDLIVGGDRTVNGFSARGWNEDAATVAIRRGEETLRSMGLFVEDLILMRKESAARSVDACDRLKNRMVLWGDGVGVAGGVAGDEDGMMMEDGGGGKGRGGFLSGRMGRRGPKSNRNNSSRGSNDGSLAGNVTTSASSLMDGINPASSKRDRSNSPTQRTLWKEAPALEVDGFPPNETSSSEHKPPTTTATEVMTKEVEEHLAKEEAAAAAASAEAKSRAGPLIFPGSSLHAATLALEQYHTQIAEADSNRWRMASSTSRSSSTGGISSSSSTTSIANVTGILPEIQSATNKTSTRALHRERALTLTKRRAEEAEAILALRQTECRRQWEAVRQAEMQVQHILEEKTRERSRERERRRILLENQRQFEAHNRGLEEGTHLETGVTQAELWELVSQIGNEIDGSSFAPTGLPDAPSSRPVDKSLLDGDTAPTSDLDSNANANANANESNTTPTSSKPPSRSSSPPTLPHSSSSSPPSPPSPTPPPPTNTTTSSPPSPSSILPPLPPAIERTEVELQLNLPRLRAAAIASSSDVDDASNTLLNILATLDTTRRSARVAAESCLLSAANAQSKCLRRMVELERMGLEERWRRLEELERVVNGVDVRRDLDVFIEFEKREKRGGASLLGEDDDGGVASALAVLNSHCVEDQHHSGEGGTGLILGAGMRRERDRIASASGMATFEGWGVNDADDHDHDDDHDDTQFRNITRDDIEECIEKIFHHHPLLSNQQHNSQPTEETEKATQDVQQAVQFLIDAVGRRSPKARTHRASACYALNNQRSLNTEIVSDLQFQGLCQVFEALLSGCDRETGDIASAKMCMMLAQTFYVVRDDDHHHHAQNDDNNISSLSAEQRKKRVYVKSSLIRHPIWSDEDFWVQALFQCVSESLTKSGVMQNFERTAPPPQSQAQSQTPPKKKWYDLTNKERSEAASQVHAVVFAQLGALAHSMVEFGCSKKQAASFVRRLSIRHQLPMSQRTMLLQHLMGQKGEYLVQSGKNTAHVKKEDQKGGDVVVETADVTKEDGQSEAK